VSALYIYGSYIEMCGEGTWPSGQTFDILYSQAFKAEPSHHEAYARLMCSVLMAILSDAIKVLGDCFQTFHEIYTSGARDSVDLLPFYPSLTIRILTCFVLAEKRTTDGMLCMPRLSRK
jgi:hypothetical protein